MTLEIEIKLRCDKEEITLARETEHLTGITQMQRQIANRVAKKAAEIISGQEVLKEPLEVHLRD